MSRPKPTVILEFTDRKTYNSEQVLEAEQNKIFAVFYQGKPINLRNINTLNDNIGPKYKRTTFVGNSGHAFNLAEKLNLLFKTDEFKVYELTSGISIEEDK